MCSDLVCARPDLEIESVLGLLVRNRIGCLPVVDALRRPLGVITKFDVVEQIETLARSVGDGTPLPAELMARTAEEVMMPLALTLDDDSTLAEAAEMMTDEDTHHVLVTAPDGTLVGVVSAKDVVEWLAEHERMAH
jgi:CBS domain-containing protein